MSYYEYGCESECYCCRREELDDYMYKIKEIIEDKVDELVKSKTEDLNKFDKKKTLYINENINLKNKIDELNRVIRNINYTIDQMKVNHKRELESQNVELTKNPIGVLLGSWKDKNYLYYIRNYSNNIKCPHCNGSKKEKINVNGQDLNVECRFCNGVGNLSSSYYKKDYVWSDVYIGADGKLYFKDGGYMQLLDEHKYYYNEKEVVDKCNKHNKEQQRLVDERYNRWKKENKIN